jgi:ribosome-binding factor A
MNSHLPPLATGRDSADDVRVQAMKKHSQRAQRVGDQIQRELAELLRLHVKDPRIGMVTVTAVEVSPDLSHAKIFVTHLGGAEQAAGVLAALQHTVGYLRSELSHRLDLYSVPQLHFAYDDSIESGLRLSKLIDDAIADDHKHSS